MSDHNAEELLTSNITAEEFDAFFVDVAAKKAQGSGTFDGPGISPAFEGESGQFRLVLTIKNATLWLYDWEGSLIRKYTGTGSASEGIVGTYGGRWKS